MVMADNPTFGNFSLRCETLIFMPDKNPYFLGLLSRPAQPPLVLLADHPDNPSGFLRHHAEQIILGVYHGHAFLRSHDIKALDFLETDALCSPRKSGGRDARQLFSVALQVEPYRWHWGIRITERRRVAGPLRKTILSSLEQSYQHYGGFNFTI